MRQNLGHPAQEFAQQIGCLINVLLKEVKTVPADILIRVHRATGVPITVARDYLIGEPEEKWQSIVADVESEGGRRRGSILRDSLELRSPEGQIIARVLSEVSEEIEKSPGRLGHCHRIWTETKRRLKQDYGIDWRTPHEINSGRLAFD